MMWNIVHDTVFLARVIENSKCFLQLRQKTNKTSKLNKIMLLRLEEKKFYGELIENAKEKKKRLKLESKGKIPKVVDSTVDSELAWVTQFSTRLTVFKKGSQVSKENNANQLNTTSNCNSENIENTEKSTESDANLKSEITVKNNPTVKETENKQKTPLLSKEVINNLLEFSIFDKYNYSNAKLKNNSEILSISQIEDKSCLRYPSVTKILSATMSEEAKAVLERWKTRMIEKLGVRGFEIYQAELFNEGKLLHSTLMNKLSQKPFEVPDKIKQSFLSLENVLTNIDNVQAIESHVVHPRLMYRGIVDCVAVYRDSLCAIDWKKSDKTKSTIEATYDAPLQLASYVGALNADLRYPFQIKKGIIVVAYTNGNPAQVHEINEDSLKSYWKLWLQRLQEYHVSLNPC